MHPFKLHNQSTGTPFIIPCIDGAISAVLKCCWFDHEVKLVSVPVWTSVVLIRLCAWRSLKRSMRVERCIVMLIEWHFDIMLVSWSQTNIQRLEFIVVNLIYVLYSMVLRTSDHELHVHLNSTFCVLSVSCCCVLTCMYARVYLRVSFVSPSHSRPYCDFTQDGWSWLFLFTILLEIVVRNNQCCELLSMFVLLFEIEGYWWGSENRYLFGDRTSSMSIGEEYWRIKDSSRYCNITIWLKSCYHS